MPDADPRGWLDLDVAEARRTLTGFLADYVDDAGAQGVVVGLSGGLDSAASAALAVKALGEDRVEALTLPGPTSTSEDAEHARRVADALGLDLGEVEIAPATAALEDAVGVEATRTVRGNLQARLRMAALYAHAGAGETLVLGTGNKSELLTGYFTKHGDGAADVLPLGDLYKTQVRRLAERLDVPEAVLARTPTAGLWDGQTDEDELGLPYATLDVVLAGIEQQFDDAKIADAAGVDAAEVERVRGLIRETRHKRAPPPVPKLGWRTVGVDWRDPPP